MMRTLKFAPATQGMRNRVRRGNVVKIEGSDTPMMVVVANYKKGVRLKEFDGPIKTHRADSAAGVWLSDHGDWVAVTKITHVAIR